MAKGAGSVKKAKASSDDDKKREPPSLPPGLDDDRILSIKQYALLKNLSVSTVRRQYRDGTLPIVRLSERRIGVRAATARAR